MNNPTTTAEWQQLASMRSEFQNVRLGQLFASNPNRFQQFTIDCHDLFIDYSKNFLDSQTLATLIQLAKNQQLPDAINRLLKAEPLTNGLQTVPYTALRDRSPTPLSIQGEDISSQIRDNLFKMNRIVGDIRSWKWRGFSDKPITDVVTLGVGGAANGAEAVCQALSPFQTNSIKIHFVSNTHSRHFQTLLTRLQPDTTLFIVSSKSFGTQETLHNATMAKQWILNHANTSNALHRHFIGITANRDAALQFGMNEDNLLPVWHWLPGRYSLWAAAGLPIALAIGMERFEEFLAGANRMDQHFQKSELGKNAPVILALISIWYTNFWQSTNHAVLPYSESLERLPMLIQHCLMEANGKSVDLSGKPVNYQTAPVIWGAAGNSSQHTYFQLLHQGTHTIPADFIAVANEPLAGSNRGSFMQFLAQTEALMLGDQGNHPNQQNHDAVADQSLPGNKPSTSIIMKSLTPSGLGQLLALYEHIAFTRSVLWNINPFTHWGTELTKRYSQHFDRGISSQQTSPHDSSTQGLLDLYDQWADGEDYASTQPDPMSEESSYYY